MSKIRLILIALTICAVAVPLTAEEEEAPPMSVAKSHFVMVNPGQALAFEAAYKGHLEWHASNDDPWIWHTWQIVNGQNFGHYIIRTGDHTWADWDARPEFQKQDGAHFLENVSQYVKKISSTMSVTDPKLVKWADDYGMPTMVDVTVFQINNEYSDAWYHTIEKIHEATVEKEIPFNYAWSFVASGGEGPGPTWSLVFPFKSWKEYGDTWEPAFWKLVEEVHGEYETDLIRKLMNKAVVHQENFMVAFRADLSYHPPQ
jgi:hypothetical protein